MPISTWIRDIFGIRKDLIDTKKSKLEVEKLEYERASNLITRADLDDVKRYDPKYRQLEDSLPRLPIPFVAIHPLTCLLWLAILGVLMYALLHFVFHWF